jgi:predicted DsbA family dithiol-disulfide isomerase
LKIALLTTLLGIDKMGYYRAKFGDERTTEMFSRLSQIGKEAGINFKFGGKTGNTRDSHRLIQLGKSKSPAMQTRIVEELFSAYFENEGDITSHELLLNAAKKAGFDEKEAKEWLSSEKGGKEVDAEVEEAQMNQITGVPRFEIQGKFLVGGAQDPDVFLRLFEKIKATEVAAKA